MNGIFFPTLDDIQAQLEQQVNTLLGTLSEAEDINALRGRLSELRTFVRSQQERVQTAYEARRAQDEAAARVGTMSDAEVEAQIQALDARRKTVLQLGTINVDTDTPKLGE